MKTIVPTPQLMKVPAGSRGGAGKVIVIILGVLFVLALVVVIGIWSVWHHYTKDFHVSQNKNGEATITTPGGTFSANESKTYTSDELGIDLYPGASSAKGSFSMNTGKGSMITATFETNDSEDAVATFYKNKSGLGEKTTMDTDNGSIITFNKSQHDVVMVTVKGHDPSHENKTVIVIVHTKDLN